MPHPRLAPIECATGPERGKDASQEPSSFGSRGQRGSQVTNEREKLPQSPRKGKKDYLGNQGKVMINWSKFSGGFVG